MTPRGGPLPRVPTTEQERGCLTSLALSQAAEGQSKDHDQDAGHLGLHGGYDLPPLSKGDHRQG